MKRSVVTLSLFLAACFWWQVSYCQSKPAQVDPEFDCGIRKQAYLYAQKLQSSWPSQYSLLPVFDALELHTRCNVTRPPEIPWKPPHFTTLDAYYVDYTRGSDSNAGTMAAPFKTILAAVAASRRPSGLRAINLREGIHYLNETIYLTPQDNGLGFRSYNFENATISGGLPLKTSWKQYSGNVWVASLAGQNVKDVLGLQLYGQRCIRARFPNANPETDIYPTGWITKGYSYKPHKPTSNPQIITNKTLVRTEGSSWQHWTVGVGGGCSIYDPPESFWCSQSGNYYTPSGIEFTSASVPNKWADPRGGIVHAWRDGHWNSWMFEIDSYIISGTNRTIGWTYGGFQGSRPGDIGDQWYVENIFEELDSPNEFFYDKSAQLLFYHTNGTGAPPETGFVATNLKVLFNITGSRTKPVKVVVFDGINFQNTAYTYMDPHGVPSGGDWGLQKSGAIYLEGTYLVEFIFCNFTRLDGNAIFLAGYNDATNIENNQFSWIGDSCIAAWGKSNQIDATDMEIPRNTRVQYNLFHDFGLYEKQSSAYFQALSALTFIQGNIIFNGPRAGINFNDGLGGGNEVTENLIFNQCRESGDHGPFNSWDRLPYLTNISGPPSLVPLFNNIHHNFFIANYQSTWSIDNDDGSSWYMNHHNVQIYAQGSKSYASGHNKLNYNNIYYCTGTCFLIHDLYIYPYNDQFYNNRVIQNYTGPYGDVGFGKSTKVMVVAYNNSIYTSPSLNGKPPQVRVWPVNGTVISWDAWKALGEDDASTVSPFPAYEEIYTWIHDLLWEPLIKK